MPTCHSCAGPALPPPRVEHNSNVRTAAGQRAPAAPLYASTRPAQVSGSSGAHLSCHRPPAQPAGHLAGGQTFQPVDHSGQYPTQQHNTLGGTSAAASRQGYHTWQAEPGPSPSCMPRQPCPLTQAARPVQPLRPNQFQNQGPGVPASHALAAAAHPHDRAAGALGAQGAADLEIDDGDIATAPFRGPQAMPQNSYGGGHAGGAVLVPPAPHGGAVNSGLPFTAPPPTGRPPLQAAAGAYGTPMTAAPAASYGVGNQAAAAGAGMASNAENPAWRNSRGQPVAAGLNAQVPLPRQVSVPAAQGVHLAAQQASGGEFDRRFAWTEQLYRRNQEHFHHPSFRGMQEQVQTAHRLVASFGQNDCDTAARIMQAGKWHSE